MLAEALEILVWMFWAIVKYMYTAGAMMALTEYTVVQIWIITVVGAAIGVVVFFFFGTWITNLFNKWRSKSRRRFTRVNRFIIKTKQRFGLVGLVSILGIISVPICAMITAVYYKDDRRAIPALILSVILWGTIFTAVPFLIKKGIFS